MGCDQITTAKSGSWGEISWIPEHRNVSSENMSQHYVHGTRTRRENTPFSSAFDIFHTCSRSWASHKIIVLPAPKTNRWAVRGPTPSESTYHGEGTVYWTRQAVLGSAMKRPFLLSTGVFSFLFVLKWPFPKVIILNTLRKYWLSLV